MSKLPGPIRVIKINEAIRFSLSRRVCQAHTWNWGSFKGGPLGYFQGGTGYFFSSTRVKMQHLCFFRVFSEAFRGVLGGVFGSF